MLFQLLNTVFHKEEILLKKDVSLVTPTIKEKRSESKKTIQEKNYRPIEDKSKVFQDKELKQIYGLYAVDGDTFIGMMNGNKVTFRLAGIDAPEKGEFKYKEAHDFLNEHVRKKVIFVKSRGKDIYNREIVDVFEDKEKNIFVNSLMLKNGYATAENYTNSNGERTHSIAELGIKKIQEKRAETNNKGIWKKT